MGNESCRETSSASKVEGAGLSKEQILEQRRTSTAPTGTDHSGNSHQITLQRAMTSVSNFEPLSGKFVINLQAHDSRVHRPSTTTIGEVNRFLRLAEIKLPDGTSRVSLGGEDFYEGDIHQGRFEGKGKLVVISRGVEYDGDWVGNMRHGKGTEKWADGRIYNGEFISDAKEGFGEFSFPDGSSYTGHFSQNDFNGYGILYKMGKYEYSGSFLQGKKHGKGKINYENGDYYEGEFYKGKRHGKGLFYWSNDENTYEGEWFNDQPHGMGFFTQKGKAKSKALFQEGKRTVMLE